MNIFNKLWDEETTDLVVEKAIDEGWYPISGLLLWLGFVILLEPMFEKKVLCSEVESNANLSAKGIKS
jgi:hypothetical protein